MIRHLTAAACLAGALAGCGAAPESAPESEPPAAGPAAAPTAVRPGEEHYHATELRPGDCLDPLPENFTVTVVSCSVPHSAEFATTYVLPDQPWPGLRELDRLAREGCAPRMRYVPARRSGLTVIGLVPAEGDWPRQRTAYCLAIPLDGGKLVGRVIL
ncbi:septum formation family protein [Nonomuraea sp. NPDC050783]|uniref:septum formation family protein n=1 Tax=Nonomuraea sp. NPDC050783 TaxID=3154634 RepID=UPI003466D190